MNHMILRSSRVVCRSAKLNSNVKGLYRINQRQYSYSSSTSSSSSSSENSSASSSSELFLQIYVACKGKKNCNNNLPKEMKDLYPLPDSCGEDSFFVNQKENMIGVADGVGGWNYSNIDPSKISRALMRHSKNVSLQNIKEEKKDKLSTQEILAKAYEKTLEDQTVDAGSTTACIIRLHGKEKKLEYTNLGDSGFAVIRNGKVIYRSAFQTIGAAPYQLAKIPPHLKEYGAIETQPEEAQSGEMKVQENDIIVLATDGLWDNFSPDLLSRPPSFPPFRSWRHYWHGKLKSLLQVIEESKLEDIANNMLKTAKEHNLKPDDITVIIAIVTSKK